MAQAVLDRRGNRRIYSGDRQRPRVPGALCGVLFGYRRVGNWILASTRAVAPGQARHVTTIDPGVHRVDDGQQESGASKVSRAPRICMPSTRGFTRRAFQCGLYEAQDVLHEIDDVDIVPLQAGKRFTFQQSWQRRLLYRDFTRRLIYKNPGLHPVRLTREYDLFLVVCQNYWDLL